MTVLTRFRRTGAFFLLVIGTAACTKDPVQARDEAAAKGASYFAARKFREASIEYARALQQAPASGEVRLKLAESQLEAGEVAKGIKEYYRAADQLPEQLDVQVRAGGLALVQGHFEEARLRAERVLARQPNHVEAQILWANALAGLRDVDAAIRSMEEAVRLAPTQGSSHTTLGDLQLLKGDAPAAESAYKRAIELNPESTRARLSLAGFYWASGRPADAERELQEAHRRAPDHIIVNRALALFAITRGKPADAEPYLKTIARVARDPASKLVLAEYYESAGRLTDARQVLKELASSPAAAALANSRLGEIERRTGNVEAALRLADSVLASAPSTPEALVLKARILATSGNRTEAQRLTKNAVEIDGRNVDARFLLGTFELQQGHADAARDEFIRVLELNPRAIHAALALTSLELARGNVARAAQYAEDAVRLQPGNPTLRLLAARTRLSNGDVQGAASLLDDLAKEQPRAAGVHATLGAVAMSRGDLIGARRALTRALELDPRHLEAISSMVTLDLVSKHPEDARARVDQLVTQTPRYVPYLILAARTHASTGDFPAAESLLKRVIDLDASNFDAYGMLAQVYTSQRRLPDARAELEKILVRQPQSVPTRTLLGMLYELDGMKTEARNAYENVLAVDGQSPVAANNLAWLLVESGSELPRAVQLATTAKQRLPDDPHINDTLGWAYFRAGQTGSALNALEDSVRFDERNATALYHLAQVYAADGQFTRSRQTLQRAIALNPELQKQPDVQRALAKPF